MQTLTYFIEHLYDEGVQDMAFQKIENKMFKSNEYSDLSISGALYKDLVFEDVIFINCSFFGTTLENCMFINCLFINCNFQFSHFNDCNFELTTWENCNWGFTALKRTEALKSQTINNFSLESNATGLTTKTLTLNEFLNLSA